MIHVFLAEKPNLDPEGYSVIWSVGEFGRESAAGPQGIVLYLFILEGIKIRASLSTGYCAWLRD